MKTLISTSDIAKKAGVPLSTVRYYYLCKRLPEPEYRSPVGARIFTEEEAERAVEAMKKITERKGKMSGAQMMIYTDKVWNEDVPRWLLQMDLAKKRDDKKAFQEALAKLYEFGVYTEGSNDLPDDV